MIYVNAKDAIRKLNQLHKELSENERKSAMVKAINRGTIAGRTSAAKDTRKVYKIRSGDIKKTMTVKRANRGRLEGDLTSKGSTLPLSSFQARKTKRGVTANIKGSRKLFPGAFITTMKSGHKGVFARAKYEGNKLVSRRKRINEYPENDLPITEVLSLTVPAAIGNPLVIKPISALMQDRLISTYAAELKFRQKRAAGLI